MNKKVEELVESVAKKIQNRDADAGECYSSWDESRESTRDYYRETVRKALNDPNLALIDRERELPKIPYPDGSGRAWVYGEKYRICKQTQQDMQNAGFTHSITPLAKALKEGSNGH